jgi:hypothetical protein
MWRPDAPFMPNLFYGYQVWYAVQKLKKLRRKG